MTSFRELFIAEGKLPHPSPASHDNTWSEGNCSTWQNEVKNFWIQNKTAKRWVAFGIKLDSDMLQLKKRMKSIIWH